jgi:photosystem II stability/assembly factor-like uncharacterized protein
MHRFFSFLAVLSLLLIFPSHLHTQPWMRPTPGEQNFYDIQRAFNEYWEGKDTKEKGKGWKQFKRWEWFWEQRVYPSGRFPNPMQLFNESRAARRGHSDAPFSGNWTEMGPSQSPGGYSGLGRVNCVYTQPTNPNIIWAGSASGGLWKSTDAGTTWSSTTDDLPTLGVTDIAFDPTNPSIMYIATGDGDASDTYSVGVLKSTDGGTTWNTTGLFWNVWQQVTLSRLIIHPTNPLILIAAGNGIHRSTDGGATWSQVSTGTYRDMEMKPGSPDTLYASGTSGQVVRSTNGGVSWVLSSGGLPGGGGRVALGVTPANSDYVYALIANSSNSGFRALCRSTNNGESWTIMSTTPNLLGWASDGSDLGGQGWYDLAVTVSQTNPDEVYTGGVNNWKSTNGGVSWTIISMWYNIGTVAEVHADQHNLAFVPGTNILYAGNDGGVYRTTNGGVSWEWLGSGLKITQFYRFGLSATNPAVLIAGSQDNGTKARLTGTWYDVLGGDGMEAIVDYTDANTMYGSLYFGDIYKSVNGGSSFFPITGGIPESGAWITPYVIDPVDPQTLYAGFSHAWKSMNGGATWEIISNISDGTLNVLAVAPSNPLYIYAARGGTLFRTTDGGTTDWTPLISPPGSGSITSIAIHPSNPNTIWTTSSGYSAGNKVYRSNDGGLTWTNISGTLPNIPANTIIYQNNSPERLYVGTDIGVYYRDLTTQGWQDFNTGLANVIVNELEIQYGVNKIRAATYGRGVWESDLIELQGRIIASSPTALTFGRHEVGSTSDTLAITVGSYGTDTVTVSAIIDPGSHFDILNRPTLPFSLPPGQSVTMRALFSPQSRGSLQDSLVIMSNAANAPTSTVYLEGYGVIIGRAQGGILYASSTMPTSQLYSLNTTNGSASPIGPLGVAEIQSLTFRPSTGELIGLVTTGSNTRLYRVSGMYGDVLEWKTLPLGNMRAFSFTSGDTLYGGTSNGRLYRINPATLDTTYIGTAAGIIYASFSFSPTTGVLWASVRPPITLRDRIYTVNTQTGDATLVGATGDGAITPAISFGPTGILYGLKGFSTQTNTLISIDTLTAAGALIGSTGISGLLAIAMRSDSITTSVPTDSDVPVTYRLEQNYPNPFNPSTNIRFQIPVSGFVSLKVYNLLGQEVARLVNELRQAGSYEVELDGKNLPSGVYFYRLIASSYQATKKLLLLK